MTNKQRWIFCGIYNAAGLMGVVATHLSWYIFIPCSAVVYLAALAVWERHS